MLENILSGFAALRSVGDDDDADDDDDDDDDEDDDDNDDDKVDIGFRVICNSNIFLKKIKSYFTCIKKNMRRQTGLELLVIQKSSRNN